jgi:hypothetical protein
VGDVASRGGSYRGSPVPYRGNGSSRDTAGAPARMQRTALVPLFRR